MSILGVKKNHMDTSEIGKEILKMKSELLTMETKDKYLYNNINILTLRILNIESIVSNIRNKPDRKIITIYAGIDGPIKFDQAFTFGGGGDSFVLAYPGQILNISIVSLKTCDKGIAVNMVLNGKDRFPGILLEDKETHGYLEFPEPIKVEAGDLIGFKSTGYNPECINTLASVIIEIFL
jgi:hypothetical protein